MNLLALDPSTVAVGWCVFDTDEPKRPVFSSGVIRPKSALGGVKLDAWARLEQITLGLRRVIEQTEAFGKTIDAAAVEHPGRGRPMGQRSNANSLTRLGGACGACMAVCHLHGLPMTPVNADVWKRDGSRGLPKDHFRLLARAIHPGYSVDADKGGDEADAICLAEWWRTNRLVAVQ